MKVCYFGNYDPEYSRDRVLMKALGLNGVEVVQCNSRARGIKKYGELRRKIKDLEGQYDIVFVGFSSARLMPIFARLISPKKIVWDAFFSVYESWIEDRKLFSPKSPKALWHWILEWIACRSAHKIILDTNEHIKYFVKTFGVDKSKFTRVFVGTDDSIFTPMYSEGEKSFRVHFHGKFIPLQGVQYIVMAASILKDEKIHFTILGNGATYKDVKKLARDLDVKNIDWIDRVQYRLLPGYISNGDISLGIFGDNPKTQLVIPNKIYEAIAMSKAVITADTPAVRELFTDRENILFCRAADPKDLANKILEVRNDESLRKRIALAGRKVFEANATPEIIGRELLKTLTF